MNSTKCWNAFPSEDIVAKFRMNITLGAAELISLRRLSNQISWKKPALDPIEDSTSSSTYLPQQVPSNGIRMNGCTRLAVNPIIESLFTKQQGLHAATSKHVTSSPRTLATRFRVGVCLGNVGSITEHFQSPYLRHRSLPHVSVTSVLSD